MSFYEFNDEKNVFQTYHKFNKWSTKDVFWVTDANEHKKSGLRIFHCSFSEILYFEIK